MNDYVYLDYAATAPLCEEAAAVILEHASWGREALDRSFNANSLHKPGRAAFMAMEDARKRIAKALNTSRPQEIIFTSGATEADNAAILGITHAEATRRRQKGNSSFRVIVSAIEHEAVLKPAAALRQQGFEVVYLKPDKGGFITVDILNEALTDNTVLVSVQMANSEIGSIMDIKALAAEAHKRGALFHTDAVQALGKIPINLKDLNVDAASFSGHKIGAPKGIGALYLKARTPFDPYMLGGGQESGKRSGTQNVCGIEAFAAACESSCSTVNQERERLSALRDTLMDLAQACPKVTVTLPQAKANSNYLPNIVHCLVNNLESQTLIIRLDQRGFGVSGGSACSSQSLDPSHVLTAIGIDADAAQGALRISMGRYTTEEDICSFAEALSHVVQ